MAIPLQTKAAPALKLPTIGDSVVVAIAYEEQVPLYQYRTDGQKVRAKTQDGTKERNQLRLSVVVMSGKAVTGEALEPVAPGEEAVIFLSGHNWFSYIEASKKLGGINVGDVMQWKYERDEAGNGAIDKKVRASTIRHAKPEEADTVAKCEDIYRRITSTPLASAAPANGSGFEDDEEPF
jgi:hypothetical protein